MLSFLTPHRDLTNSRHGKVKQVQASRDVREQEATVKKKPNNQEVVQPVHNRIPSAPVLIRAKMHA
jgi:hypothetical protein